jgi:hypothetical protein
MELEGSRGPFLHLEAWEQVPSPARLSSAAGFASCSNSTEAVLCLQLGERLPVQRRWSSSTEYGALLLPARARLRSIGRYGHGEEGANSRAGKAVESFERGAKGSSGRYG